MTGSTFDDSQLPPESLQQRSMLQAALAYAARGWPVFPVHSPMDGGCSCGKALCKSPAKHPRTSNGFKDATTRPDQIKRWWTKWPDANIGIATGKCSKVSVLDVDPRHGGAESLAQLEAELGPFPKCLRATTGGGGEHIYVADSDGRIGSRSNIRPGLDTRGEGGYVVAAPSVHISGGVYAWQTGCGPDEAPPAPLTAEFESWAKSKPQDLRPKGSAGSRELRERAAKYLASVPPAAEGGRNDAAFRTAGHVRSLTDDDGLHLIEEDIVAAMREWNARCTPPLSDDELKQAVASSASNGTPRPDKPPLGSSRRPPTSAPLGDEGAHCFQGRPLTDSGNAERLVEQFGADFRFCAPWKKWLHWDGSRWVEDTNKVLLRHTKQVARTMFERAAKINDPWLRDVVIKFARQSEAVERRNAMLKLATCEKSMPISPSQLDAHPHLLNCPNGTIDLRTGKLQIHRREDFITKITRAAYKPEAKCPLWEKTLERVLPDDDIRNYFQRVVGYSLTGSVREQLLFILQGDGANGKSTVITVLQWILTGAYAIQVSSDLLIDKGQRNHPTEIADLFGIRIAVGTELNAEQQFDEALLKQLTGGDLIRARRMREDFWQFPPTHKLFLVTNHLPKIKGTDYAIARRLHIISFEVTIPAAERDKKLTTKLQTEAEGILAWAVRGCMEWQRIGLNPPDGVQYKPAAQYAPLDIIADFVGERVVRRPGARLPAAELYEAFQAWCEEYQYSPSTQTVFGTRMGKEGYGRTKSGGNSVYLDLELRPAPPPEKGGSGTGRDGTCVEPLNTPRVEANADTVPPSPQLSPRQASTSTARAAVACENVGCDDCGGVTAWRPKGGLELRCVRCSPPEAGAADVEHVDLRDAQRGVHHA